MFVELLLFFMLLLIPLNYIEERNRKVIYTYIGVAACLFLIAGFRPYGVDEDSLNYLSLYDKPESELIEPSFYLIAGFVNWLVDDPRGLFVLYALIGVSLKAFALPRLTYFWFSSLLIWMGHYYILQDLTQMRVAAASGFFLVGIYYLAERRQWMYVLFVLLAMFFHFSAVILLLLLFLSNKPLTLKGRKIWAAVPIFCYGCYFMKVDPVLLIPIPYFQNKIAAYEVMRDIGLAGDAINVFGVVVLLKLMVYYFLLWQYDRVYSYNKYFPLLLKVYGLSLGAFAALAFLPVLSFRVSELFGVVDIVLIPMIIYTVRPRYIGPIILSLYAVGTFMLNVFYNGYLKTTF